MLNDYRGFLSGSSTKLMPKQEKNTMIGSKVLSRLKRQISGKILVITGGFLMLFALSAMTQESKNLFRNSELTPSGGGIPWWSFQGSISSGAGYKGKNSVCIELDFKGRTVFQSVMSQRVTGLKPGNYLFSAYVKFNKKIETLLLCRIIEQEGKHIYQTLELQRAEQEENKWTKLTLEFDIPEGISNALIALDLRDTSPGAKVWIDSPLLVYKSEQDLK